MVETGKDRRSLEDFWKIIWRRKWVVGLFVLAVMAAVTMGILVLTPIFEASATLHVKEQMPSVLGTDFWGTGISDLSPATEINTQMEILKSTSVLMDAISSPGLTARFVSKADLGDDERLRLAVESLKKSLSVTSVTNTRLIRVAVRSKDPELAMETTNAICRAFINRNVESKRSEANAVLAFVSDQVSQVSASLDRAEEDLLRYKQSEHITILADEAKLKLDRIAELESQYQQVKLDRQILQARINGVQRLGLNNAALGSVADTPSVKALQDRLTAVESDFSRLKPGDPSAVLLRQQADSLEKDIQAEIERTLKAEKGTTANSVLQLQLAEYTSKDIILSAQEEVLRKQIAVNEADISRLSTQEINLFKLERARRINDELYSALMKAKNEAQIEAISQIGSIDVIDPAVIPIDPVSPRKRENLIVGFLLSLLMGVCFTFLLEYFDNTVKSEEEAKKLLGIPLIGHIPKFQTNGSLPGKKRTGGSPGVSPLFTRDEPGSSVSEAFRLLRMNLFFIELDKGLKTIAVTSAVPGEGKTTIAANLAVALAAQEERVLIMDADFRAPAVHRIFNLPQTPGFMNILTDRVGYRTLIRQVQGVPNLSIITAGPIPPNPAEIIGSSKMKELIGELRDSYDRVIFDTPPVLGATDAVVLASLVDGTLLALRTGKMDRRGIKRMGEIFANTRAVILGGVLNGVDNGEMRYSYRYYSSAEENRRKD